MGTISKQVTFCLLFGVLGCCVGFFVPQPKPAHCITDKDCLKGVAKCVQFECQCTGVNAVGDGKDKCETEKKCFVPADCYTLTRDEKYRHSKCIFKRGKSLCKCLPGYFGQAGVEGCLKVGGTNCLGKRNCPDYSDCDMKTKKCQCNPGYVGNGLLCKLAPTVKCNSNSQCSSKAKCENGKCICQGNYIGNGKHCRVGKPCNKCGPHQKCIAEPLLRDVHECRCSPGLIKHGRNCVRCLKDNNCPTYSRCINKNCKCKDGLVGNGKTCKPAPVKKCSSDKQCSAQAKCENGKCICQGKTIGNGQFCRSSVPCSKNVKCGSNSFCLADPYLPKVHECRCNEGYVKDKDGKCHVPCPEDNNCGIHQCVADQTNPEKYECVCNKGYKKNELGECVEFNECEKKGVQCPADSTCQTTADGSHECACKDGFKQTGDGKDMICEDKDECLSKEASCTEDRCTNTPGSYTCAPCQDGYSDEGDGKCVDIDECTSGKATCPVDRCTNSPGSYECASCPEGTVEGKDGKCGKCNCGEHGYCEKGNLECTCDKGYQYSQEKAACTDLNECDDGACPGDGELCINNEGSYECECKPGYLKKGDGCVKGCNCGKHEVCYKGKCRCKKGYVETKPGKCVRASAMKGEATSIQSIYTITHVCVLVTSLLGHLAMSA